jgi:hypothetical protein
MNRLQGIGLTCFRKTMFQENMNHNRRIRNESWLFDWIMEYSRLFPLPLAPCSLLLAPCPLPLAPCPLPLAPCPLLLAPCSFPLAPCFLPLTLQHSSAYPSSYNSPPLSAAVHHPYKNHPGPHITFHNNARGLFDPGWSWAYVGQDALQNQAAIR